MLVHSGAGFTVPQPLSRRPSLDSYVPRASTPRHHRSRTCTPTRLMTQVLMKLVLLLEAQ
ncbi:hypothetical protein RHMOL_Rhmol12G0129400 [Rhododendron molle]|uniref:Uncharacterized protein n=1 Tax=Rhododendron molle TaxID=49168 RepID=A0ACC0LHG4_RHOML|nr:hypothetical protein RHMOL_Rhmol12G0129400 [Rhododendron molle]